MRAHHIIVLMCLGLLVFVRPAVGGVASGEDTSGQESASASSDGSGESESGESGSGESGSGEDGSGDDGSGDDGSGVDSQSDESDAGITTTLSPDSATTPPVLSVGIVFEADYSTVKDNTEGFIADVRAALIAQGLDESSISAIHVRESATGEILVEVDVTDEAAVQSSEDIVSSNEIEVNGIKARAAQSTDIPDDDTIGRASSSTSTQVIILAVVGSIVALGVIMIIYRDMHKPHRRGSSVIESARRSLHMRRSQMYDLSAIQSDGGGVGLTDMSRGGSFRKVEAIQAPYMKVRVKSGAYDTLTAPSGGGGSRPLSVTKGRTSSVAKEPIVHVLTNPCYDGGAAAVPVVASAVRVESSSDDDESVDDDIQAPAPAPHTAAHPSGQSPVAEPPRQAVKSVLRVDSSTSDSDSDSDAPAPPPPGMSDEDDDFAAAPDPFAAAPQPIVSKRKGMSVSLI